MRQYPKASLLLLLTCITSLQAQSPTKKLPKRGLSSDCVATLKVIDKSVAKAQSLTVPSTSSGTACHLPIFQASLPFTASTDGVSYIVVGPLSHTGSSPAITVSADGVTINMCGHALTATSMSTDVISITGSQLTLMDGTIQTDGSGTGVALSTAATETTLRNININVTGGSSDAIVNEASAVQLFNISVQLDSSALGRGIYIKGTNSGTTLSGFIIDILNTTGSGLPAIHTETAGNDSAPTVIENGVIHTQRDDVGSFANQSAILLTRPSGTDAPAVVVQDVAIRTVDNNRGVYVLGGGDDLSTTCLRNLTLRSNSGSSTGILITNTQTAVQACQLESYDVGIEVDTSDAVTLSDNVVINSTTGYLIENVNSMELKRNSAFECSSFGFSVSGPTTRSTDVYLGENSSINLSSGGLVGTGFSIAATCDRVTLEKNFAQGHATGFSQAGGATVLLVSANNAVNNTTNYSGVSNTFSHAALTTQEYWHNATP